MQNRNFLFKCPRWSKWEYSTDGSAWTLLTGATTFGWGTYVNYGGPANNQAWHSVSYGWSKWLRPTTPVQARYVRYHWDGNLDSVAEIDVDARTITSSSPPTGGTSPWNVLDTDTATGLATGYQDWQHVTIDLGRPVRLSRLRRHMTGPFDRTTQGESWAISNDGVSFRNLVASDVTGWEAYVNYGASNHAWRAVPYGWSAWLELKAPTVVRYVSFLWDGNADSLNEVEIDDINPGSDPNYDAAWTTSGFTSSMPYGHLVGPWSPAPTTWQIITAPGVGFSGFYDGQIYSNVGTGKTSRVVATLLQSSSGEVRGIIHVVEGLTSVSFGGLGCSNKTIPAGTRLFVRMQPWTNNGRFSEAGFPANLDTQYLYASGSTSRPISGFFISGTADFHFYAQLWNQGIGAGAPASHLTVYVDYSTPCSDGPPLLLTLDRNNAILRTMAGY